MGMSRASTGGLLAYLGPGAWRGVLAPEAARRSRQLSQRGFTSSARSGVWSRPQPTPLAKMKRMGRSAADSPSKRGSRSLIRILGQSPRGISARERQQGPVVGATGVELVIDEVL
jgi:hypothetical protein